MCTSYDLSPRRHWHWYSELRLEYAAESMLASASASERYLLIHCGLCAVLVSVLERGQRRWWGYLKMMQHNRQTCGASSDAIAIVGAGELEEKRGMGGIRRAHRTP